MMGTRRPTAGKRARWSFTPLLVAVLLLSLLAFSADAKKSKTIKGPIKTVVVMVMENRSFDNILGWLKRLNPEVDGLTGAESNPMDASDPNSERVYVNDQAEFVDPDPGHSYGCMMEQIFGGNDTSSHPAPMNGFVQNANSMGYGDDFAKRVMGGYRPEVVPAYTALAMEFAVFDRWFASAPTSTQPNRLYCHSATSHGEYSNLKADLIAGFPQKSIMEAIADAGLSWGIYYQNIPATLFFRNLRKLKNLLHFKQYSLWFKLHAKLGLLPNYVVLEQRYFDLNVLPANDDHPSHDVAEGQKLIKEVYEILRSSPQWKEMLFLITYDEHGGFFDHVPSPNRNVPNPDQLIGRAPDFFKFDRLGVRVPTIAISPWINKGTVVHGPDGPTPSSEFEHSSISATVKKIFGLDNFLTKRDEWAGTFESVFSQRTTPRDDCPVEIPSSPWSLRHSPPDESRPLTEFQQELVQLASQLNGDHVRPDYPHIGKKMNVSEGNEYVNLAVERFFREGKQALKDGVDESVVLQLQPLDPTVPATPVSHRRFGDFHDSLLSSA